MNLIQTTGKKTQNLGQQRLGGTFFVGSKIVGFWLVEIFGGPKTILKENMFSFKKYTSTITARCQLSLCVLCFNFFCKGLQSAKLKKKLPTQE